MSKPSTNDPKGHDAATYELRLQAHLDARWANQLGIATLIHDSDGTTVLHVVAADQSALHGLLQRIRDLGLPLVSVARLRPPEPEQLPGLPTPTLKQRTVK